jgi:RimJ/RimL family protein N-acetyltransferase
MITLRRAKPEDCHSIFEWRNHPKVRQFFLNNKKLTFSEHEKWFEKSLKMDDRIILIAYDGTKAVGVLRYDIIKEDPRAAEIAIYVAPELQGRGYGKQILNEGNNWLLKKTRIRKLVAKVIEENRASVRMFKKCQYKSRYLFFEKEIAENENSDCR